MNIQASFECKCGLTGWVTEGHTTAPCPTCKRRYKGVYSKRQLDIIAKEIKLPWWRRLLCKGQHNDKN